MFRSEVVPNAHIHCRHLPGSGSMCESADRVANVRLWNGEGVVIMNDALCFTHRQNLLQVLRDAIMTFDQ